MTTARGRRAGIVFLLVTKGFDTVVTIWSLREFPRVTEQNWVPWRVFDAVGLTGGVVLLTGLSLAVAVVGIEAGAVLLRSFRSDSKLPTATVMRSPTAVRVLGYGSLGTVWAVVSIHNATVLGAIVAAG